MAIKLVYHLLRFHPGWLDSLLLQCYLRLSLVGLSDSLGHASLRISTAFAHWSRCEQQWALALGLVPLRTLSISNASPMGSGFGW